MNSKQKQAKKLQIDTPLKSTRKKCLDCSCGQPKYVRECPSLKCHLWPYRMGRRPTTQEIDIFINANK